jgi:hypothetical protein
MPFAPRARCGQPAKHRLRAGFSATTFGTVNKGPGMVGTGLLEASGCPPHIGFRDPEDGQVHTAFRGRPHTGPMRKR